MVELRLVQVDAFAERPFTGNPAAVMPLDRWLPDDAMQAIAMENNLAETAFTVPAEGDADYELRWFTPTVEVDLCGHATLASGHVLMGEGDRVRFRTRKSGILTVGRDGAGLTLDLPPIPVETGVHTELLEALQLDRADVFLSTDASQATAIILVADAQTVRACRPDFGRLKDIPLMAIVTARGDDSDVISRVFVPAWGIDEDPVTGSAHAALTPFWCDRLGRSDFRAFQASRRGGHLTCRQARDRVILGGGCVTVLDGVMRF
ncbi:MAG TPA: PhzF family phenazine biosynthesis protein [Allosphingosinicella sp.]|nr:PhzF family phenazine biosynthesis protein [Allosphingosinicella sp.]